MSTCQAHLSDSLLPISAASTALFSHTMSAVPEIVSVDASTPQNEILDIIYREGLVHLKGFLSSEEITNIKNDLQPHFESDDTAGLGVFAPETKPICGLAGKSPAAVRSILQRPTVKAVVDDSLTVTTGSWWGDAWNECTSTPLLSSFFAVRVGPGSARQGLHRDDQDHHATHTHGDPKETTKFGVFVALTRTTKENGATEIVPRSHTWDDKRKPREDEVTYGEMEAGDAILMLGNCYHGAGANKTKDEYRSVVVSLFCKGMLRSEENQFLAVPRELVEKMDHDVQDLLGWKASRPFCGWHEFANPSDLLRGKSGLKTDLF